MAKLIVARCSYFDPRVIASKTSDSSLKSISCADEEIIPPSLEKSDGRIETSKVLGAARGVDTQSSHTNNNHGKIML